jgi:hypothetical protein
MKRLFRRFLSSSKPGGAPPPVDLERLLQMLEYARRRNLCGRGTRIGGDRWIGRSINIESEEQCITARAGNPYYKDGTIVTRYRHVSWSYMPHHLGVYLVDGSLEFRASHDGIGPRESMPLATDPEDLSEIKCCFDFWYDEFDLPASLGRPVNPPKQFEPTGDAVKDIQTYLEAGTVSAFHELFEDDDIVIWVDWGEEDDNIVNMVADVLGLDNLSAKFDNATCDLLITYRGVDNRIAYPEEGIADRDTTIIALNRLLQPEYELRVCNASRGSDTLALLALKAEDWSLIEHKYPAACVENFTKIDNRSVIFGKSG